MEQERRGVAPAQLVEPLYLSVMFFSVTMSLSSIWPSALWLRECRM